MESQTVFAALAASALAAWLLAPMVRWCAVKTGAVDFPDGGRKHQPRPVATLGGIAVFAAIVLGWLFADRSSAVTMVPLLFSAVMVCLLGIVDDVRGLKPQWKLLGQIVATLPIVQAGSPIERMRLLGLSMELDWLGTSITILWLLTGINALNLLDGMDGLGSCAGIVIAIGAAACAAVTGRTELLIVAALLAGALLGFLVHNRPPARIYLGDTGSMVIGMVLAYLTMHAPQTVAGTFHPATSITLMAIPIYDTLLAVIRRTLSGREFWIGDRQHIHHCLLGRGMSAWQSLRLFCGLFVASGICAWLTVASDIELPGWLAVVAIPVFLYQRNYCGQTEWSLAKSCLKQAVAVMRNRSASRLPDATELQGISFDSAWQRLVGTTAQFPVHGLTLSIMRDNRQWNHHWNTGGSRRASSDLISLQVSYHSPGNGSCLLEAEVQCGPAPGSEYWLPLFDALELFAKFWAFSADNLPTSYTAAQPVAQPLVSRSCAAAESTQVAESCRRGFRTRTWANPEHTAPAKRAA